jgi:hypothetical protein
MPAQASYPRLSFILAAKNVDGGVKPPMTMCDEPRQSRIMQPRR